MKKVNNDAYVMAIINDNVTRFDTKAVLLPPPSYTHL